MTAKLPILRKSRLSICFIFLLPAIANDKFARSFLYHLSFFSFSKSSQSEGTLMTQKMLRPILMFLHYPVFVAKSCKKQKSNKILIAMFLNLYTECFLFYIPNQLYRVLAFYLKNDEPLIVMYKKHKEK